MTKDEARQAKREMLSVCGTDGVDDDEYHGIIVQVGYHESGREDLVAIEGRNGVRWYPHGAVRLHPGENAKRTPRPIDPATRRGFLRQSISRRDMLAGIVEANGADAFDGPVQVPSRAEVLRAAGRVASTGRPERIDIGLPFTFDIDTTNWPLA